MSSIASSQPFFERLQARVDSINSLLCVGLDPHSSDLGTNNTPEGAYQFCKRLIDATIPYAAAYKPNAAFFEIFGAPGMDVLKRVIESIPSDIPVVLDVKRGDISTTAEAYAGASYTALGAHCVTLNGYMGIDSIEPFTRSASTGVFVLCKTSNPSSNELQTLSLKSVDNYKLYEQVAKLATTTWNSKQNVGLVVGATDTEALGNVRKVAPEAWILAPGVGFQGGDLYSALSAGLTANEKVTGLLLPVSRGISRAADPAVAAKDLRDAINKVRDELRVKYANSNTSGSSTNLSLASHQREFIETALNTGVLRFGTFTLKSGRISPYFFNAGLFRTGGSLAALGRTYAKAIVQATQTSTDKLEYDILFGPAYKGIPLVTTTAVALADLYNIDIPVCYNRKEAKDHGEGGTMVGADVNGKRVLIVDDVISAGTAVGEAIQIITQAGGIPAGVIIGLDRQEKGGSGSTLSAVQQVKETYKIPVIAVATLTALLAYLKENLTNGKTVPGLEGKTIEELLTAVQAYRTEYGVDSV